MHEFTISKYNSYKVDIIEYTYKWNNNDNNTM